MGEKGTDASWARHLGLEICLRKRKQYFSVRWIMLKFQNFCLA